MLQQHLPLHEWAETADASEISALKGGYSERPVWLVKSSQGMYVLKRYAEMSEAEILYVHGLMHYAGQQIPQVPAALRAKRGTTVVGHDGALFALVPFMKGSKADRADAEHRQAAAVTLAQLHSVLAAYPGTVSRPAASSLADLDWRQNHWWDWALIRDYLINQSGTEGVTGAPMTVISTLERHLGYVDGLMSHYRGGLPMAPVHGDYWAGNVLVARQQVTGVLDWDEAHVDWRAYEVANAAWQFCRNAAGDALDITALDLFMQHYVTTGARLSDLEQSALMPLIRMRLVWEILFNLGYAATGHVIDLDYVATNLRSLSNIERIAF